MGEVNQTIPTMLSARKVDTTANLVTQIHQKIALALRQYNGHITWISEQLSQGNVDNDILLKLLSKPLHQKTHQSPIEEAINARFIDPQMVSILDNDLDTQLPNHIIHTTAKLMTLNKISLEDFPPVCQVDSQNAAAMR